MNKKLNKIYLPMFFAIVLVSGIFLGKALNDNPHINYAQLYRANNKLGVMIDYIETRYVDTISRSKLEEAAIPGILDELDPHSVYIPAKNIKAVNEDMRGNFEGIGVTFNKKRDTVVIMNVILGGPSHKVGVLAGDRIIMVDDSLIAGQNVPDDDIVGMLKGEKGTKVNVSVEREKGPKLIDFEIIRDKVPLYSVDVSYMIDDEIGFIKISRFSGTTYDEFIEGAEKLLDKGMKKLILDLRGNSGGYMVAATNIIDQFLEAGKMIVYTQGKSSPKQDTYSSAHGICKDIELIVLQDEFAASASEIVSGAIQDNDRGTIIGRRSFGKGLVQEPYQLSDGSVIRLTIARYYTPTGRCIQKPYSDNKKDYYNDLNERYQHGEFLEADSIQFADSLKYFTTEGNIVYGGGGIMPDIFVPLDTTGLSKYYAETVSKGMLYDFAFKYVDEKRVFFTQYEDATAINNYLESINIFDQFADYAEQNGVPKTTKGFSYSRHLVNTRLKAGIALNIIDKKGFYPIFKDVDVTLKVAISYFKEN
ncbi:MAG: PDZ domain-containing protein [Bacteroidales bacterium]|nr:PDZ domain-containing protein [Bacteroidales bacterium]